MRHGTGTLAVVVVATTLGCAAGAAAAPSAEETPPRFRLVLNGLLAAPSLTWSETSTFTLWAETATIENAYTGKPGPGVDLAAQVSLVGGFGVMASVSYVQRKSDVNITAQLPHPLYPDRLREAGDSLTGLTYSELGGHLSLAYTGRGGALEYTLFAGGSLLQVQAQLVNQIVTSEQYPYDTTSITSVTTATPSGSAFGFHGGARLDLRLGRHFAVGVQARYAQATVKLSPQAGSNVDVKAGGLQSGAGVRVLF